MEEGADAYQKPLLTNNDIRDVSAKRFDDKVGMVVYNNSVSAWIARGFVTATRCRSGGSDDLCAIPKVSTKATENRELRIVDMYTGGIIKTAKSKRSN